MKKVTALVLVMLAVCFSAQAASWKGNKMGYFGSASTKKALGLSASGTLEDEDAGVVNIPASSKIAYTPANIAVPSSYFMDLRGRMTGTYTWNITADYAVLHDASGNTMAVTGVNVTITTNGTQAGSVANGRDQAGDFAFTFAHTFIISKSSDNGATRAGLLSLSATAPTLPAGYDQFMRTGAIWIGSSNTIFTKNQIGERFWADVSGVFLDTAPTFADTPQELDLSSKVPATAKIAWGRMGTSGGSGSHGIAVSSVSDISSPVVSGTLAAGGANTNYYPHSPLHFCLPFLTPQRLWWMADSTGAIYSFDLEGWEDDL